jgi:hypothetical protein
MLIYTICQGFNMFSLIQNNGKHDVVSPNNLKRKHSELTGEARMQAAVAKALPAPTLFQSSPTTLDFGPAEELDSTASQTNCPPYSNHENLAKKRKLSLLPASGPVESWAEAKSSSPLNAGIRQNAPGLMQQQALLQQMSSCRQQMSLILQQMEQQLAKVQAQLAIIMSYEAAAPLPPDVEQAIIYQKIERIMTRCTQIDLQIKEYSDLASLVKQNEESIVNQTKSTGRAPEAVVAPVVLGAVSPKVKKKFKRWTRAEHSRYIEALKQFTVDNNDAISAFVGTRSPREVRAHSYYLKTKQQVDYQTTVFDTETLIRDSGRKYKKWTEEEQHHYEEALKRFDANDYSAISAFIGTKTISQVKNRRKNLKRNNEQTTLTTGLFHNFYLG